MKILVITLHADPTINPGAEEGGGTHLYVNELINLLVYKNIQSLIITRKASPGQDCFEFGKVKVQRIKIGPEGHWDKNNLDDIEDQIKEQIQEELTRHRFIPDLVHSIYWHSGRAGIFFADKFKTPVVHTIISAGLRKQFAGFSISNRRIETEKKIFERASILTCISQQEADDLISFYHVNPDKIKIVGRGVDNIFMRDLYDLNGTLLPRPNININLE